MEKSCEKSLKVVKSRMTPLSPDVILEIEGIEFETEKSLLASKSPYFEAMFSGNFKENAEQKITIKGVSSDSMKIILDSLIEESIYIEDTDLVSTLQASCMLQFENVKNYCLTTIVETLSYDNCLEVYFMAIQLDLLELAQKALCIALLDFDNVVETQCFLELDVEQVHSYLAHTALHSESEIAVFEAAMKWFYEHEQNINKCKHERNPVCDNDQSNNENLVQEKNEEVIYDYCTVTLLTILQCIDFKCVNIPDLNLLITYPGISRHSTIECILKCIISIKSNKEESYNDNILTFAKRLLNCKSRSIPKLPCIIGVIKCVPKNVENREENVKRQNTEKSYVLYFEKEMSELIPLIELKHVGGDGPDLEGYKVEVWANKLLLLGGEFMFGFGNWSKSCWVYDTTKNKWFRLTMLPSVRRHFKTCIVKDELYVIGGTGQYRVIQNNMDCYNLKTDTWVSGISFPYDIHDIECCEYNGNLLITCGGRTKIETLLYSPETKKWTQLKISDPNQLYKTIGQKEGMLSKMSCSKNFKSYMPFMTDSDLYISGNYLLGLRQRFLDMEVFYFGPGIDSYDDDFKSVDMCVINNTVYSFCCDEKSAQATGITYSNSVRCFNIPSKQCNMIEIKNKNVRLKHFAGCFSLFHYSLLSFDDTITKFGIV